MNTLQRYMVLNSLVLVVIPVMGQQKEEGDMENYNKPFEAPLE